MKIHPLLECASAAEKYTVVDNKAYQVWKCRYCSCVQSMKLADKFYIHGRCAHCEKITNTIRNGHDYYLIMKGGENYDDYVGDKLIRTIRGL